MTDEEKCGMAQNRLMLIVNPNAGRKRGKRLAPKVIGWLREGGFNCRLFITKKRGDGTRFAQRHGGEYDVVVCMGGDGTLNEVINGILKGGHNVSLGYIPAGSTNDFARSLNISKDPKTAVNDIIKGHTVQIDTGKYCDRYFSYVASFGAFTKTSYSTPQVLKNVLGRFSYFVRGAGEVFSLRPEHIEVDADGKKFEGEYLFGAISNSKSIGGLVKYKDKMVDFSDGRLEMMLIKKPDSVVTLCKLANDMLNQNFKSPYIKFCRAKEFKIKCKNDFDWTLDGEFAEGNDELCISCVNKKLNIICPQKKD